MISEERPALRWVLPKYFESARKYTASTGNYFCPASGKYVQRGIVLGYPKRIEVGNQRARILFIPAHTRGHIAYVFDDAQAVFCGDTMFAAGCGRLFEGTPEMMFTALHEKLGALPDSMRVYCGHEYTQGNLAFAAHLDPDNQAVAALQTRVESIRANKAADWHDATPSEMSVPSTIGDERLTNPFLRAKDAADLGRIRALKDSF